MRYADEYWDWPPTRRFRTTLRFRAFADVHQPPQTGWNNPIVKKIVHAHWRFTLGTIKILLAAWLSLVGVAAFWLLWTIVHLYL